MSTALTMAQRPIDKFVRPLPSQARAVVDFDDFLTQEDFIELDNDLVRYDSLTGNTIVLLILPSLTDTVTLRSYTIEATALAYFNTWGIGRKETNRGVLILLVPSQRQVRITVGRGLETVLTNETCSLIIQEQIIPHFKEGAITRG
ncbi:TPM domain-containing protein [Paraflavitalea pollutisoli]|uniref:TPM domain-containing protein n=1 Tax=Paraflavitalea pollutisoli TaxID=3034143 RepID=UPI0023EAB7F7|nr:TPM domain-containing protein [Paraflavitalea sp. H1-2-19X]